MVPTVVLAAVGLRRGNGGIAVVSRLMLRCLARMGKAGEILPRAVVLSETGPAEEDPLFRSCNGMPITWCGGSHLRFCWSLARGPRSLTMFDHVGLARAQRIASCFRQAPYQVFIHGVEVWEHARADHLRALRGATGLVANSRFTADRARRQHTDLPSIRVCPLALEEGELPCPESVPFAENLGEHVILTVGRMCASERYKGHEELIDAMPVIRRRVSGAQLVLVGSGDDAERLRDRAIASGCGDHIFFAGHVSEMELHGLYQKCAVFAMPSRGEGFGLVYLEAMAHGKPCVGSIQDAAGEVIRNGETGLLVDATDVGGTAEAIADLLVDEESRLRMGEAARRRQRRHFTFDGFARRFTGIVRCTLDSSADRREM